MYREEAEALAASLELGLTAVSKVVDWAIERIGEQQQPHWSLCELAVASSKHPQDVAVLLREVPGVASIDRVRRRLLCAMAEQLERNRSDARLIASALYQMAIADEIDDPELRPIAGWAYDAIDLAEDGMIVETRDQVVDQMLEALQRFARTVRSSLGHEFA